MVADNPPPPVSPPAPKPRLARWQQIALAVLGIAATYFVIAYIALPAAWLGYTRTHPKFDDVPGITHTADGIPGDPLNVAFVGSEDELKSIMIAAKWYPADPLTLESCLRIASATVLERPYDAAPVSNLFLFGRKQDLAFEQPVGNDPRQRHHVRFWQLAQLSPAGRTIWVGSAVFDAHVGLSRTTGQITHVTAPQVDAERADLFANLQATGKLAEVYFVDDFHEVKSGKNGGGDPWQTDGRLEVGIISPLGK